MPDSIPKAMAVMAWAGIFASFFACNKRDVDKDKAIYCRANKPCEVVVSFEKCCGVFADRYIITNKNRYKVNEGDNIVAGDSVCRYDWSDTTYKSSKLGIKDKDIFIHE